MRGKHCDWRFVLCMLYVSAMVIVIFAFILPKITYRWNVRDRGGELATTIRLNAIAQYVTFAFLFQELQPPTDMNELIQRPTNMNELMQILRYYQTPFFSPEDVNSLPTDPYTGIVVDGWKNPLRLVVTSPDVCTLVSCGPNGRFEEGKGDDLTHSIRFSSVNEANEYNTPPKPGAE